MRKLVTAAAAALTLSTFGFAAPALADHDDGYRNGRPQAEQPYGGPRSGPAYDRLDNDRYNDNDRYDDNDRGEHPRADRWRDRKFDFDRHNGRFDSWERGWRHNDRFGPRHGQTLNYHRLVRQLERQGYYGVRGLRQARWGWGLRAFAYNWRGQPVMLRVNPYSGRVLDVRYI
ncbi:MAG: hypothetical protein JNK07_09245 [Alphaproteobacteria bacterium]|nr:hypothetical protein [Alphaproteobacteria bacterium]